MVWRLAFRDLELVPALGPSFWGALQQESDDTGRWKLLTREVCRREGKRGVYPGGLWGQVLPSKDLLTALMGDK